VDSNLIIKPEIRFDTWSNGTPFGKFIDNDGLPTDKLSAFTIAAIYKF